jgi:hypothetical protein
MSTPKSPSFQGRFGRMFRSLPAATYGATDAESRSALMALGVAMSSTPLDRPKDGFDNEESAILALYTYFGQFVDHDITFDPMTTLIKHNDPDAFIETFIGRLRVNRQWFLTLADAREIGLHLADIAKAARRAGKKIWTRTNSPISGERRTAITSRARTNILSSLGALPHHLFRTNVRPAHD